MSRTIRVTCLNIQHCGHVNIFLEDELISGMSIKNDKGYTVEVHPPVIIDENTFVKCEKCGYPISCQNASITED